MQNTLTFTAVASLTDAELRDELNHAAYVVARLLEAGSTDEAGERLKTFTVLRLETQHRHS
ncbi:hypothetical protein [Brevibacterium yomogidense]|uniref:hypothetical protein n=1 Tax=Brevibacterium yomogidense TaxID=946573 RepID=UPI0018DFAB0D|nr:hypothetical protein [Brevibacterium yomogidense]